MENDLLETIVISNSSMLICGVYRPFKTVNNISNNQAFLLLVDTLKNITIVSKEVIIGGDFNVDWHKNGPKKNTLEIMSENSGLVQLVDPVRQRREVSKADGSMYLQTSCLDLVFTDAPVKVEVLPAIQSDHDVISVQTKSPKPTVETKKIVTTDWRKYSQELARYELTKIMKKQSLSSRPQTIDNLTRVTRFGAFAPNWRFLEVYGAFFSGMRSQLFGAKYGDF